MLHEIQNVSQIKDEPKRRWFTSNYFDLIVWFDDNDIIGFQLIYNKFKNEHALTWWCKSGYTHNRIDDGENRHGKAKATPILIADGYFDHRDIAKTFQEESGNVEKRIAEFVIKKLFEYSK